MSNVTLEIAGRRYTIACAEGEEQHIEMLGASIDDKLAQLESLSGQSPERVLLYAALLLADELHETKTQSGAPQTDYAAQSHTATNLESMAERLETLAMQLETS